MFFFKPPLKNSPLEKIYDPDTGKCSLGADFYDIKSFRTIYLLVRYSYSVEYKAEFSTWAGPSQCTFNRSFKFDCRKLSKGALTVPPSCTNIPKWDSKMLEHFGLGRTLIRLLPITKQHSRERENELIVAMRLQILNFWHQGEQKWTTKPSPDPCLPQGVWGRYLRGFSDIQSQTLTTQLITEFIHSFTGVLFAVGKQPNDASDAPPKFKRL